MPLIISTPGAPQSTPGSGGTLAGLKRAHELGIRGMELEWVQSVPKNPEHMEAIRALATELGITLTVHAPYFVNLNSPEPEKLAASKKRVIDALAMAQLCGAVSVVVHAAFYLGKPPELAFDNVRRAVDDIMKKKKLFPDVNLALETMGKPTQFGTMDEVLRISEEFGIYPCVDPAHLHARSNGAVNSAAEWHEMLDAYEGVLGKKSLKTMHLHFSGIAYGPKGEKHHLTFEECDAPWRDFVRVLHERGVGGQMVCESPAMEWDTIKLRDAYEALG
jgi:deoxyribonuclease IV